MARLRPKKSSTFNLGRIPFRLKQKSLITVSGQTLRPGGFILTRRAAEFCNFSGEDCILDVGCGYGMTHRYLKETLNINATGVDPDPGALTRAAARSKSPAALIRSELPCLPFKPGYFNGIFCECVLSLVQDREAGLGDLYRIMAPNGRLVLIDRYIRKWKVSPNSRTVTSGSCLDGAVPMIDMLTEVEQAGFKVDIVEDHSELLSQLGIPTAKKTGYCMIIAGKH